MPRPLFDRDAIEAEIDRLRSIDLDALRTLWRVTFRCSPPPAFTKDLMARFLCWHIQEQASAGLIRRPQSISTASHGATSGERIAPGPLKPGTVLLREYQGERHNRSTLSEAADWSMFSVQSDLGNVGSKRMTWIGR